MSTKININDVQLCVSSQLIGGQLLEAHRSGVALTHCPPPLEIVCLGVSVCLHTTEPEQNQLINTGRGKEADSFSWRFLAILPLLYPGFNG